MCRVFQAFHTKMERDPGYYRFMFKGDELFDDDSADTRRLVDNSIVDAIIDPSFQQPPSSPPPPSSSHLESYQSGKLSITVGLRQEDGTYAIFKFKRVSNR